MRLDLSFFVPGAKENGSTYSSIQISFFQDKQILSHQKANYTRSRMNILKSGIFEYA